MGCVCGWKTALFLALRGGGGGEYAYGRFLRVGVLIGTSGFSYEDWKGVFYPPDLPREDYIRFYSMFFPIVELDFSYYRMPEAWRLEQLAAATPKEFLFTIKAHRSLTHEYQPHWAGIAAEFRAALYAREFKDRLAGILLQFPFSFHYTDPNRLYLGELTKELSPFPQFLEFRNSEWTRGSVFEEAEKRGIGIVSVDAPALPNIPCRDMPILSAVPYVRFHGRNAEAWWGKDGASRYDYSYAQSELIEWAHKIAEAEKKATKVFSIFNNHPNGNAVLDARRLKALVDAEKPRLEALAKTP